MNNVSKIGNSYLSIRHTFFKKVSVLYEDFTLANFRECLLETHIYIYNNTNVFVKKIKSVTGVPFFNNLCKSTLYPNIDI